MDVQRIATEEGYTRRGRSYAFCPLVATLRSFFAESGLPGRVDGTRELVIDRTPYIAAYRVAGVTVQILRVLHGAQRWPEDIPQK